MDTPQNGQPLPPAGWFTDPQAPSRERWWDGAQWTEHQRDRAAVPPPTAAPSYGAPPSVAQQPYTPQPAYAAAAPQPVYRAPRPAGISPLGKRAAILGIVAGGLFVLGFLLLIVGGAVKGLNFLLILGVFSFFAALICGLVAVILAIVAAARRG